MTAMMNRHALITITVNGLSEQVPAGSSLAELIERFQEMDPDLIVEHNGRFVYPNQYPSVTVSPADRVEFVHPNFGG
jgi:sulfur carrier protein